MIPFGLRESIGFEERTEKRELENENLKEKLRELQTEKSMWTDSLVRNSNGKKATAMLALLFMVSLNMNSLTEIYK